MPAPHDTPLSPGNVEGSTGLELGELIERRNALRLALAAHEASVRRFWPGDRPSFVIQLAELAGIGPDDVAARPRHLTSTASCFESLADVRPGLDGQFPVQQSTPDWSGQAGAFAVRALAASAAQWRSDNAADIYCRVRALPAVLRYAPDLKSNGEPAKAASRRLQEAFQIIDTARPLADRGLGERPLDDAGQPKTEIPGQSYPANTFHAYWGLKANRRYEERRKKRGDLPALPEQHLERVRQNEAWASAAVGRHTALLNADKRRGDAQQLAFAVLADFLRHGRQLTPESAQHDLYEAALAAFFSAQEPSGRWPLSRPLFHYPMSGNAYCYTFETLTELLRPSTPREEGRTYRALLEPYLVQLFAAWDYAYQTRVPLGEPDGDTFGWSSTHHVGREAPEGWATAEVFSFGQMLRCFSGHIIAERAATELGVRRPEYSDRESAELALAERGDTWAEDGWTVGRQLAAAFLHPAQAPADEPFDAAIRDPDAPQIQASHARSAVLFGPPGTGKTSIVEALAGALGWQFVEILASDFLREGVDGVPAQADVIFERLMQLDRCVVLFDEIDELIQDRTSDSSDPFGRFLTTSMLPKIAKLWKQRRLIFFVATNHVSRADAAITRTSRFDARIFVPPPALAVKRRELSKIMNGSVPEFEDSDVAAALQNEEGPESPSGHLGVLALLRFDQIPGLARRLQASDDPTGPEALADALTEMRKELLNHEWQPADPPADWQDSSEGQKLAIAYKAYVADISRDFSKVRIGRLDPGLERPTAWPPVDGDYRRGRDTVVSFFEAPEDLQPLIDGDRLSLPDDAATSDRKLLWFVGDEGGAPKEN